MISLIEFRLVLDYLFSVCVDITLQLLRKPTRDNEKK